MGGFLFQQVTSNQDSHSLKLPLPETPAAIPFPHATVILPQGKPLEIQTSDQMGSMLITPIQILQWAAGRVWAAPQPGNLNYPLPPIPLIHLGAKTRAVESTDHQLPGLHTCNSKKVTCPSKMLSMPSQPASVTLIHSHCMFGMALGKPTV